MTYEKNIKINKKPCKNCGVLSVLISLYKYIGIYISSFNIEFLQFPSARCLRK